MPEGIASTGSSDTAQEGSDVTGSKAYRQVMAALGRAQHDAQVAREERDTARAEVETLSTLAAAQAGEPSPDPEAVQPASEPEEPEEPGDPPTWVERHQAGWPSADPPTPRSTNGARQIAQAKPEPTVKEMLDDMDRQAGVSRHGPSGAWPR